MATTIIATQQVTDFAIWKQEFDAGAGMRDQAGISIKGVYQSVGNPNTVTIISEVPNPDVAKALFSSAEIQESMKKGGVIETLEVKILNEM